jgi:hypothetical protein
MKLAVHRVEPGLAAPVSLPSQDPKEHDGQDYNLAHIRFSS